MGFRGVFLSTPIPSSNPTLQGIGSLLTSLLLPDTFIQWSPHTHPPIIWSYCPLLPPLSPPRQLPGPFCSPRPRFLGFLHPSHPDLGFSPQERLRPTREPRGSSGRRTGTQRRRTRSRGPGATCPTNVYPVQKAQTHSVPRCVADTIRRLSLFHFVDHRRPPSPRTRPSLPEWYSCPLMGVEQG